MIGVYTGGLEEEEQPINVAPDVESQEPDNEDIPHNEHIPGSVNQYYGRHDQYFPN